MKLVFATNNQHKADEIKALLLEGIDILTLKEAGIFIDIPEPHDTLEANATEKSSTIYNMIQTSCFSEDTGLEVEALNGEPGVKSARYAGENRSFDDNITKLLTKLEGQPNRKARFRTVVSLIIEGKETQFEGICEGSILTERQGSGGFGYDPVFIADGADKSFGEMTMEEKSLYSHRKKAVEKLVVFLNNLTATTKQ
ncbi:RdgB/HAM1 family non-canonical purine NTP pyrophosphatase [Terrimonas rubra]|uniref:dITP/XTP pyrophosphatase n=1 Tax=Terrimonas rubra TaxID=1035890 RepID=A0ABW6A4U7_9BACT